MTLMTTVHLGSCSPRNRLALPSGVSCEQEQAARGTEIDDADTAVSAYVDEVRRVNDARTADLQRAVGAITCHLRGAWR